MEVGRGGRDGGWREVGEGGWEGRMEVGRGEREGGREGWK